MKTVNVQSLPDADAEIAFILGDGEKPMVMGGAHEAAGRYSRELATWNPPSRAVDADILPDKKIADARTQDMMRNDAFVQAGATLHKDNIVGAMLFLNAKPVIKALRLDDKWATEFQEEVEAKFTLYAESLENWMDASRRNTLTSMTRLAVGTYLAGGELLATSEWMRGRDRPYQTALQMVELNRLCDPGDQAFDNAQVRGGIRFNKMGAPQGYYIRKASPGMNYQWRDAMRWDYIPQKDRRGRIQVLHIMEQMRPGQSRGLSQLVAALKEMRITKRFRDVTLQNAVVNASFAASIESEMPSAAVFESLGGGDVSESIIDYATSYLGAIQQFAGNARNMSIDGVRIPHLMPGTKLNMLPMGTPGGVGSDFEASLLRYIAANLDVSYEQLSKDYTQTNYSSARAGMVETWKAMQSKKRLVVDRFASTFYRLWFEEAVALNDLEAMKYSKAPNLYDRLMLDAYTACDWIGAARGQIDELKETQAAILRLNNGLGTYEDELGKQGKDWRVTMAQVKRERELMKEYKIEPLGGNSLNAASGTPTDPSESEDGQAPEDQSGKKPKGK
jgi:lambda family phage portal protein